MSSGTYTFSMTAEDLVTAALRLTGRFGNGDTIPPSDKANVLQALNIIVKAMVKGQKPLWCMQRLAVPLLTGVPSYNLSTVSGNKLPLRVTFCFIRDSTGNDTEITMVSRDDYSQLGQKSSKGVPNQAYYDPQLSGGTLTLYDVPQDSTRTLYVDIQRQAQDFNLLTDNPDFPQEAYHLLKWTLADEIALEYLTPQDIRADISKKADAAYLGFFSAEHEEVSTFFTPSERTR